MTMPLDGIRVIDWTIWQQGPVASVMLGDLGAEVIKIEERVGGDPGRGMLRMSGVELTDRPNFYFEANNRNKKSLALDLKQPAAREIIYKLAAKSDVFVQNFRQGVASRLGLGAAALRQHNPKLIYASASGYGPEGPESGAPSFDYMAQARSGIMMSVGEPDMPPMTIVSGLADQMGAIMLAYGVLAAVIARERFGVAQDVDASHLGSMMWLQGLSVSARAMMGFAIPRQARAYASNPLWNHYRCSDGKWLALGMLQPDRYWVDLTRVLGKPELGTDARFANLRVRAGNAAECVAELDAIFAAQPRDHWIHLLTTGGDFIFTIVNSVDDLPDDPQVIANRYIHDFEHPTFGTTKVLGVPFRLSATPGSVRTSAPEFGQHTEEVLTELLGYSWEDIGRLREQEVI